MLNLREARTQRALAWITGGVWFVWTQATFLVLVARPEGSGAVVLMLSLLILAGICTLLLGMVQTCILNHEAWRMGWEARDRQDQETPGAVPINGHRPSPPRQLRKGIPTPAGSR